MVRFEAKCPNCGAINKNVYLEETDCKMVCEKCGDLVTPDHAFPVDWYRVADGYDGEEDVYIRCEDGSIHTATGPWQKGVKFIITLTNIEDETDKETLIGRHWAPIPKCNYTDKRLIIIPMLVVAIRAWERKESSYSILRGLR